MAPIRTRDATQHRRVMDIDGEVMLVASRPRYVHLDQLAVAVPSKRRDVTQPISRADVPAHRIERDCDAMLRAALVRAADLDDYVPEATRRRLPLACTDTSVDLGRAVSSYPKNRAAGLAQKQLFQA